MTAHFKIREIARDEKIQLGDFHSITKGKIAVLASESSVGKTPNDFSKHRIFYRIDSTGYTTED
jgi:hypothetical protein